MMAGHMQQMPMRSMLNNEQPKQSINIQQNNYPVSLVSYLSIRLVYKKFNLLFLFAVSLQIIEIIFFLYPFSPCVKNMDKLLNSICVKRNTLY